MIMIDWVSIVRHSRRRFSNFAGGGRQRNPHARGGMFVMQKSHHHKTLVPTHPSGNITSPSDEGQPNDDQTSSCCFSNVRIRIM